MLCMVRIYLAAYRLQATLFRASLSYAGRLVMCIQSDYMVDCMDTSLRYSTCSLCYIYIFIITINIGPYYYFIYIFTDIPFPYHFAVDIGPTG